METAGDETQSVSNHSKSLQNRMMRTAKECPPAKLPWATPGSIDHQSHYSPPDHTSIITVTQEKEIKRIAPTASPPKQHSPMQLQASQFFQHKATLLSYAILLLTEQEKGSALASNKAGLPTEVPPQ
eukprot:9119673-Ditylum_brightwellii.AAC.1